MPRYLPRYLAPSSLDDALAALGAHGSSGGQPPLRVLAGATDVYPAAVGRPIAGDVLDLTAVPGLDAITQDAAGWRIPALVTWAQIASADLPAMFDGLRAAALTIGGVQIQNVATVCGNLCNASPAADGIPNLLALDARVELVSVRGTRVLPVADFVLGNRSTARQPDELVTAVLVPSPTMTGPDGEVRSGFLKLGARAHLVISIVMVAAVVELSAGRIEAARIAVGACSPVALRLSALEHALRGQRIADAARLVRPEDLKMLTPIDDVRAGADYRRDVAQVQVRRLLARLAGQ